MASKPDLLSGLQAAIVGADVAVKSAIDDLAAAPVPDHATLAMVGLDD